MAPTYKCIVTKTIWREDPSINHNCGHAVFIHEIDLPFPPSKGISLRDTGWSCDEILTVSWDADKEKFHCRVKEDFPYGTTDLGTDITYDDLKEFALDENWEITNEVKRSQ